MSFTNPTAQSIHDALVRLAVDGSWRTYQGSNFELLKQQLSNTFQREHVRLCCSGTFGIELAIRSLKLPPDSEVLLSAYDFPGNFRSIEDAGASVALFDIGQSSFVPDVDQLEASTGPKTRAVVISHLHGCIAPMERICRWAKEKSIHVVEDGCQEPGAQVAVGSAQRVGSWGDLSVLSFGGSKLLSAGRGGAVMTNDARLAQRMTVFCERGNDSFSLSEIQSAMLIPQLEALLKDNELRSATRSQLVEEISRDETSQWLTPIRRAPHHGIGHETLHSGYYKVGLLLSPALRELTHVLDRVRNGDEHAEPMQQIRHWILRALERRNVEIGAGFQGFVGRSARRCRRSVPLTNSQIAAAATLVLHHSHLLDPQTGESTVDHVIKSIHSVFRELTH